MNNMKELYISPELEILTFLPVKGIAASWGTWANNNDNLVDSGLSTGEGKGDYDEGVDTEPLN